MKARSLSLPIAAALILSCLFFLFSCTAKKEKGPEEPGFLAYTLLDDGTYSVALKDSYRQIDLGDGSVQTGEDRLLLSGESITVPETYEGKPVTQIADCGFMGSQLKELLLPQSITYIGKNAFYGMDLVDGIELPDGVKIIGDHALDFGSATERKLVLPLSVEYLGISALGRNVKVMYMGELEDFGRIKSAVWSAKDGGYEVRYTETPYSPPSHERWFLYWEEYSVAELVSLDYSKYITEGKIFAGIWKHTPTLDYEFLFSYTPFFDGKTYTYTKSEVTVTSEAWQRLKEAEVNGNIASFLDEKEASLLSKSESKEDFALKLEDHYADLYGSRSLVFSDGNMTVCQSGVPSAAPRPYVELNLEAYEKTADGYRELFSHISGKPYQELQAAYGTVKHHYKLTE